MNLCFSTALKDLSRVPKNNGAESSSAWKKLQRKYETVHPNLVLVLSFVCTAKVYWRSPTEELDGLYRFSS